MAKTPKTKTAVIKINGKEVKATDLDPAVIEAEIKRGRQIVWDYLNRISEPSEKDSKDSTERVVGFPPFLAAPYGKKKPTS